MSWGAGMRAPENSQAKPVLTARLDFRARKVLAGVVEDATGREGEVGENRWRKALAASRKRKTRR